MVDGVKRLMIGRCAKPTPSSDGLSPPNQPPSPLLPQVVTPMKTGRSWTGPLDLELETKKVFFFFRTTLDIEFLPHKFTLLLMRNIQLKLSFAVVIFVTAALQCFYQNCTNLYTMLYGNCNCKYLQLISL